jgi:hypothetical protein
MYNFLNTISNNLKENNMKEGMKNIWQILAKTGVATQGLIWNSDLMKIKN